MAFKDLEVWFITGAQLLYGGDAVVAVDAHSNEMVKGLNESGNLPVKVVYKGTANSSSEISEIMRAANGDTKCIGMITWMHTFSPAKMWIHGLLDFKKPLLHLRTQFNQQIPWSEIDMDYMNLNHRLTATANSVLLPAACANHVKSLLVTGKTNQLTTKFPAGCAFVLLRLMLRIC